jgi:signal transduction histidine kinase
MQLKIEIFEDLRRHGFRISNNGPAIPPELWNRIFDAGFTTRGEAGEGMGLTICRELLAECGGTLKVYSNNNLTTFDPAPA